MAISNFSVTVILSVYPFKFSECLVSLRGVDQEWSPGPCDHIHLETFFKGIHEVTSLRE